MWTYAPWQGRYLPAALPARDRLRAYATWCNAVEGNTTFYATPAPGTVLTSVEIVTDARPPAKLLILMRTLFAVS